ncbi:MAG: symmetrical bis(5'-nucleosyl)-tetraphosphatase [Pseudomonadota bacterium]
MATWVVGDVQGCRKPLKRLLKRVNFSWDRDLLWSTGDLINRGPSCLKSLRFFYKHRDNVRVVLGNHDLHLLAIAAGTRPMGKSDTLGEILAAEDRNEMLCWLEQQPLLLREGEFTLVHAGIPPQWSVYEAEQRAREVEAVLRGPQRIDFYEAMYGNEPDLWSDDLRGMERLRVITNYLTRMRFCSSQGRLDLQSKGAPTDHAEENGGHESETDTERSGSEQFAPWFQHADRKAANHKVIFGHWAALGGVTGSATAIALDTGCVWGNAMTLYCLETGERVIEPCSR